MTSPNLRRVQCDTARRRQFERDTMFDGTQFVGDRMTRLSVRLSKAVVFGFVPICIMAWLAWGKAL